MGLSDFDLEPLAELATLDSLLIRSQTALRDSGGAHLTAEGIRKLRALHHLRRLILDLDWPAGGFKAVSSLRTLEDLDLSRCVSGRPLKDLKDLDLARYWISEDKDLVHLKNLPGLRRLFLPSGVKGKSLASIKSLKHLEELGLWRVEEGMGELGELDNLHVLDIREIGPMALSSLKDLSHLKQLSIGAYIPGDTSADQVRLPDGLQRLEMPDTVAERLDLGKISKKLECVGLYISLEDPTWLTRKGVEWLGSLPNLKELILVMPKDDEIRSIAGLTALRGLALTGECGFVSDEGMKALTGLQQLESLKIDSGSPSKMTDVGMGVLRSLTNLRRLDILYAPNITSKGLSGIWELKQLRVLGLHLEGKAFKGHVDDVLAHVADLSELEELTIEATLTDEGLKMLAGLKKLRRLDLTGCTGYTDDGLASLMKALPALEVVKISYRPAVASSASSTAPRSGG